MAVAFYPLQETGAEHGSVTRVMMAKDTRLLHLVTVTMQHSLIT